MTPAAGTTARRAARRLASLLPANPAVRLDDSPICSFTFDDCPRSALDHAGGMLEAAGAGGTFFISAGSALKPDGGGLMWAQDLVRARAAGHELGCHTYSHPHLPDLSAAAIADDTARNLAAVRTVIPDLEFSSFAYPFGEVSFAAKAYVARHYALGRGIRWGLNGKLVDLADLRGCCILSPSFSEDRMRALVRTAVARRAWLVFVTHEVTDSPSDWGCTPRQFEFVLEEVQRAGCEILTLKGALGRIAHRVPRDA